MLARLCRYCQKRLGYYNSDPSYCDPGADNGNRGCRAVWLKEVADRAYMREYMREYRLREQD